MVRNLLLFVSLFLWVGCATPVNVGPVPVDHPASPQASEAAPPIPSLILRQESQDMPRTHSREPAMGGTRDRGHGMSHEGSAPGGHSSSNVYTCAMHPEVIQTKPGVCPKCGMSLVAGPAYTCTMHPEVIQTKPGPCPKCGMSLVKREGPE